MKQVMDWWLPDADTYFERVFEEQGFVGFQQDRLEAALQHHRENRGPNIRALDIGAHTGMWTRRLAEVFIDVIAFEPNEETFACLRANVGHLPNVTLVNAALGDEECLVMMDRSYGESNTGGYFVQKNGAGNIRMTTLDRYLMPPVPVSFIKIDVEGAEPLVVRGGAETISASRPTIIMELKNGFVERFSEPPRAAYNALVQMGARPVARWRADHLFSWR